MEALLQTIINFFKAIYDIFISAFEYANDAIDYAIDFFKDLPAYIFDKFADGIVSFFASIPVPEFVSALPNVFSSIPAEVIYFAQPFNLGYGLSVVLSAYLLRFIVRRIPFIG